MLQIGVCDDSPKDLVRVETLIYDYLERNHIDARVDTFSHPDDLMEACEQRSYQILFLDIVMPMMSGIDVGRDLRKKDSTMQIIFCTSEPGFALEAYDANPTHYLLKPLNEERFYAALTLAIRNAESQEDAVIVIKTKQGYQTLLLDDILYLEYVKHAVRFVMRNDAEWMTTTIKGNFADYVKDLIDSAAFIKPHASYMVNMERVNKLSTDSFSMDNGDEIPISRNLYGGIRDAYLDYRLKEGNAN